MRYLLVLIGLLVAPLGAFALTWDFDEGTTWGWTAQESLLGTNRGPTTVYSEVEAGVWRIAPVPRGKAPAISLVSPLIGEDSALFDWVTLRLRIIHDRPTEGNLWMAWSNVESRRRKKEAPPSQGVTRERLKFSTGREQLYPIEWENITIDIRALEAGAEAVPGAEITWQDTLFHLQLDLNLNIEPLGPADHPAFVEVDWIQLTGAEELLLGELQPQKIAVEAELPEALFAEPRFSVLGQDIDGSFSRGTLGDMDGDGDADLVVSWKVWELNEREEAGWIIATSDGLGGLVPTREVPLPSDSFPEITGADFDGDGLLDLVFMEGRTLELWHNRGEDGFETILQLSDVSFEGLADGDGDGDVDLLVVEDLDDYWSNVTMWINDGAAGFAHSDRFVLDTEEELGFLLLPGQSLGEAVRLLWGRPCYKPQGPWRLTQPWAASQPPSLFFEIAANPCDMHLLADLDGDGAVELVGTPERNLFFDFLFGPTYHGLALWRVDASGGVERHTLLGPQVLVRNPYAYNGQVLARDLTGDGLLDLAVVDANVTTGPALVVLVGPARWGARRRRALPAAGHRLRGARWRCKRRWGDRSGRAGAECGRGRRGLRLPQPRRSSHRYRGRDDDHTCDLCPWC